jgi:D-arabinose 1-dehydrogenase-like Zn-dependent alcohol dehydrogenase
MRSIKAPLLIEDSVIPRLGPNEVLVQTRTCGICGTDLHILEGHGYVPSLPHILGHEPAGVVAEVGSEVRSLQTGDRVVPHLFFTCGHCWYCLSGREQQCAELQGILGVLSPGAFAEYFKAPARNLFRLPESVSFAAGGLIADAVLTSVHAVNRSRIQPGDSALVLGAGGVGQILIQILTSRNVRVSAIDVSREKLDLARKFGAELAIQAGEAAASAIREFSRAGGVQCVFNCVGTSASMRLAADAVMRCGRIIVIGEEPQFPAIDTIEIAQKELEIVGSRNGSYQEMTEAIRLLENGTVKPHVAGHYPLEEINDAFAKLRGGASGRIVVVIKD